MAIIRLGDGRYALRWRDAKGTRHYETLDKGLPYSDVKKAHAAKILERDKGKASKATVLQLCKDYLELHGTQLAESGYERAKGIVANHIEKDPIGGIIAANLSTKDILLWRSRRKGASDATLDREYNFLRAAITHAVNMDELDVSPLKRGAVKRLVKATDGKIVYFTPEEWRAFITALDDEGRWKAHVEKIRVFGPTKIGAAIDTPRRYGSGRRGDSEATAEYRKRLLHFAPVFTALLWTGSRLSEVLELTWEHVDLRGGYVRIEQGKTGKPKTIPISDEWRAEIERRPRGIGRAIVYTDVYGRPHYPKAVQDAFAVYRDVAGLREELTPHAIRHTVASWMGIAGRPVTEIQQFLGHASLAMTMRYVHLAPVHLKGGVAAIEAMKVAETTEKNDEQSADSD